MLCLSSLARPTDGRERRPTLGSLRESGELEHDADIVLLLHRERMAAETECIASRRALHHERPGFKLADARAKRPGLQLGDVALLVLEAPTYPPEACPLCRDRVPIVKPGSRPTPGTS